MKIAVLGAGISGLGSAYLLSQKHEVDLYEKEGRLGGHARTTMVEEDGKTFGVDTGFLVFNHPTYPLLTKLFERLDVKIEKSDMSFGFWDEISGVAYNAQTLGGLFFQKKSLFSLAHYRMIWDIMRFNKTANAHVDTNSSALDVSLGEYLASYSEVFKARYLIPMGAAIWSTPSDKMNDFPARTFVQFFKNHGLLGVTTQHQWLTVSGGSKNYVAKIEAKVSGKIIVNSDVIRIKRHEEGVTLIHADGSQSQYDKVVMAMHAPQALEMLEDTSTKEREILSAFAYKENEALLHNDKNALYPDKGIYAAWNYKTGGKDNAVTLSYWINRLQNLKSKKEYFVSLNETSELKDVIEKISYEHPQFDGNAIKMQARREEISGENHTYYAGAYWRYGFHEDGLWSANTIAQSMECGL
ncbi:MAG: COG2907: Amine oxidase, flavin-containing [uncultured Sulfurovum sp.]|uniref:COG2907: Amine oxidase, flavin-containing n=1 Tax=uncultured Sulfurovum sp. TaxID=269237 RepID=A0A6S6TVN7_9BACT|nr:MAG: COG2907: Amine oxidase, flavin-containing [uncultured Sulfurovum sp.]